MKGSEAEQIGNKALMTCAGHQIEYRCCEVVHYRSIEPILVGAIIRAENVTRECGHCPEPVHGLWVKCCVCGNPIRSVFSLTTNENIPAGA